jgi:hypothetical protein
MEPEEWLIKWVVTAKEADDEGDWVVFRYQVKAPASPESDVISRAIKGMAAFYFQCIAAGMSSEAASKTTGYAFAAAAEKVLGKADEEE